jgi:tetratricopeptide (TPR) repeat protein
MSQVAGFFDSILKFLNEHMSETVIFGVLGLFAVVIIYILQKRDSSKLAEQARQSIFPFKVFKNPAQLEQSLFDDQALTLTKNKFVDRTLVPRDGNNKDQRDDRILIIGRAETGKTRYAVKHVTDLYHRYADCGSCVIAYSHKLNIQPGTPPPIPDECKADTVIILLDDIPPFLFSGTLVVRRSKDDYKEMVTSLATLEQLLNNFYKANVTNVILVATARAENVSDHTIADFWGTFKRQSLADINDRAGHDEVVRGMAEVLDIKVSEDALSALYNINKGYSLEALQLFLRNRKHKENKQEIGKEDVDKHFQREAHYQWRKETFEPLLAQRPEIRFIYDTIAHLTFDLQLRLFPSDLVVNVATNIWRRNSHSVFRRHRLARAISFLMNKKVFSVRNGVIACSDYQVTRPTAQLFPKDIWAYSKPFRHLRPFVREVVAWILISKGLDKGAQSLFKEAAEIFRWSYGCYRTAAAYYNRGYALTEMGKVKSGLRMWQRAVRIRVTSDNEGTMADAHFNIGVAYGLLRKNAAAILSYEKAVKHGLAAQKINTVALAHYNMATEYDELDRSKDAIAHYKAAAEYSINIAAWDLTADAYYNMAVAEYYKDDDTENAEHHWNEAIRYGGKAHKSSTVGMAYYQLGVMYSNREKYEQALPFYSKAVDNATQASDWHTVSCAYKDMGMSLFRLGDTEGAIASELESFKLGKFLPDKGESVLGSLTALLVMAGTELLTEVDHVDEGSVKEVAETLIALYADAKDVGIHRAVCAKLTEFENNLDSAEATHEYRQAFYQFKELLRSLRPDILYG